MQKNLDWLKFSLRLFSLMEKLYFPVITEYTDGKSRDIESFPRLVQLGLGVPGNFN